MDEEMDSLRKTARLAGLLYLLCAATGGFSVVYIRSKLIVFGDAATTANNIIANESLFRLGIASNLFSQLFMLFLGLTLFRLFKGVNKAWATVVLASILTTVAIAVFNTLNRIAALIVLSKTDYLGVFPQEQLNALALIFLRLNNFGLGLSELFLAPYLFAFGVLITKSRFVPRILGVLLMISSFGFPINTFTKILVPEFYPASFTQLAMSLGALGGVPIILWLLIKGVKEQPRVSEV